MPLQLMQDNVQTVLQENSWASVRILTLYYCMLWDWILVFLIRLGCCVSQPLHFDCFLELPLKYRFAQRIKKKFTALAKKLQCRYAHSLAPVESILLIAENKNKTKLEHFWRGFALGMAKSQCGEAYIASGTYICIRVLLNWSKVCMLSGGMVHVVGMSHVLRITSFSCWWLGIHPHLLINGSLMLLSLVCECLIGFLHERGSNKKVLNLLHSQFSIA